MATYGGQFTLTPSGTKIWLVAGITDMRNGFNGLAAKVQTALKDDPMSGHVFIFR
ncbi:IS66 family insertion sequence element accessory protein TnpB, partial [Escherichia coli]